jgi:hypothetical protein
LPAPPATAATSLPLQGHAGFVVQRKKLASFRASISRRSCCQWYIRTKMLAGTLVAGRSSSRSSFRRLCSPLGVRVWTRGTVMTRDRGMCLPRPTARAVSI